MTGLIKSSFQDLDKDSFLLLYKTMVRSQLEYDQPIWSPYKQKHIIAIEKVKKKSHQAAEGIQTLIIWRMTKKTETAYTGV